MKLRSATRIAVVLLVIACAASCSSGSSSSSDTTTGPSTSTLATRLDDTVSVLIPAVNSSASGSLNESLKTITYGTSTQWSPYVSTTGLPYLAEIFGDTTNGPVTQIRVLVSQFKDGLTSLLRNDPDLTCAHATAFSGGDRVTIAFYGPIPNGSSGHGYYHCVVQDTSRGETTLYGRYDSDGSVRVVDMQDSGVIPNTEDTTTRGTTKRIYSVVRAAYTETTEIGQSLAYLDLQYAQATINSGPDGNFSTIDGGNVIFKSRSRIIGRVVLDANGNPTSGVGDFQVTKYDASGPAAGQSNPRVAVTQTMGRGSFNTNAFAIFSINSTAGSFDGTTKTFCIQFPETAGGAPVPVDTSNCTSLEAVHAWGTNPLPLPVDSETDRIFDQNTMFTADDLIANDGSNFTIPTF